MIVGVSVVLSIVIIVRVQRIIIGVIFVKVKIASFSFFQSQGQNQARKQYTKKGLKNQNLKKLIMNNFLKTYEMSHYARFIMD